MNLKTYLSTSIALLFLVGWNIPTLQGETSSKNVPHSTVKFQNNLTIYGYVESSVLYFEITQKENFDIEANYIVLQDDILMRAGYVTIARQESTTISIDLSDNRPKSFTLELVVTGEIAPHIYTVLMID